MLRVIFSQFEGFISKTFQTSFSACFLPKIKDSRVFTVIRGRAVCIWDAVRDTTLAEEMKRLHAACSKALSGVDGVQAASLAHHHDKGGFDLEAATLFHRCAVALRAGQGGMLPIQTLLQRAHACVQRCEASEGVQCLEMNIVVGIISCYPGADVLALMDERFKVLQGGPAMDSVKPIELTARFNRLLPTQRF